MSRRTPTHGAVLGFAAVVYISIFLVGRVAGERVDAALYYLALFAVPAWAAWASHGEKGWPWRFGLIVAVLFVSAGLALRFHTFGAARSACDGAVAHALDCRDLLRRSRWWPLEHTLRSEDTYIAFGLAFLGSWFGFVARNRSERRDAAP